VRRDESGARPSTIASPPRSIPWFVGRTAELAELLAWFERAAGGERRIVFVTGEPGIGKTTLVESFLARIAEAGDVLLGRGQCVEQYGAGEAYMPILEAFGRLCREPRGEQIIGVLERHAPTWLARRPALLETAELDALQRRVAGASRERMLRELAEAIDVLTAERPLVLWLEDLHWSDVSTVALLAMLGRRQEAARLLVIGTYRPVDVITHGHALREVKQELALHGHCHEMPLRLLSEEAVEELLRLRFGVDREAVTLRELARVIYDRTEGNPLFVVSLVTDLVGQGSIVEVNGRWAPSNGLDGVELPVPASLRQMIELQLDHCADDDRALLEVASVAGTDFSSALVAACLDTDVDAIEERCAKLARGHFLQAKGVEEWPGATAA